MNSRNIAIFLVVLVVGILLYVLPSTDELESVESQSETNIEKPLNDEVIQTPSKKEAVAVSSSSETSTTQKEIPDFASIKDVKQKKSTFFTFMLANIGPANKKVIGERTALLGLISSHANQQVFSDVESKQFQRLSKKYRVDKSKQPIASKLSSLKQKIDIVPSSLILAQSANESAWGTSRFARKGNNYFGQWCYSKGCGLVPASRDSGASHEVAKFSSVQKSVEEYIYNINVGRSYKKIRQLREQMVNDNKPVDSLLLATGLEKYSERGKEYVKEIQSMIRYNKLQQYD